MNEPKKQLQSSKTVRKKFHLSELNLHPYTWYKLTPKTSAETRVEILNTTLTGFGVFVHAYDNMLQEIEIKDGKLTLEKDVVFYLRLDISRSGKIFSEISFMVKPIGSPETSTVPAEVSTVPAPVPTTPVQTVPSTPTVPAQTTPSSGNNDKKDDFGDVDSDFWDNGSNGSGVYDDQLPVPEITEVENGDTDVTVRWSCEDGEIDGYYIYRSKDGKEWSKIATITDIEIEDYEDDNVSDGDLCGYIVCSFAGNSKSENSVPEYTYFLKKPAIKSVKSNASKKLNVKWSTAQKATGYQIRYSTTRSFTKTTTASKDVNSAVSSSLTVSRLKGGKIYYVQIRTCCAYNGEIYYSEWSPSKIFGLMAGMIMTDQIVKAESAYWLTLTVDVNELGFTKLAHMYYQGNTMQIKGRVSKSKVIDDPENDDFEIIENFNKKIKIAKNCKVIISDGSSEKQLSYKKWKKVMKKVMK